MVEPVRVLWLIKGLGPGGAEKLLVAQAGAFDSARFELRCDYLLPWKDHLAAELNGLGMPTRCVSSGRAWDLRWLWRLRRGLQHHPVDIVHAHSPLVAALARLVVRSLPRSVRPSFVYTEHNTWDAYSAPTRALNWATFALNDRIIAVSEAVGRCLPGRYRDRAEVLVHGIDIGGARAAAVGGEVVRQRLGCVRGDVLCLTIANFRRGKDHGMLLDAVRHLDRRGVDATFALIGQGPLQDEIEEGITTRGLEDRVHQLGYQADPMPFLDAADVFVLSSRQEGLPVAIMEAQATGCPVVSTAVGGVPSAVTDGREGHLVPVGRSDLLADALERVITDSEHRSRLSAAALARSGEFDVQRAVSRLSELYEDLRSG